MLVGHLVPLRPADRAEDDSVGRLGLRHRVVGHGHAMRVISASAAQPLLGVERAHAVRVHPGDQLLHLGHDLGTDPIAGEKKEIVGGHGSSHSSCPALCRASTSCFFERCIKTWMAGSSPAMTRNVMTKT